MWTYAEITPGLRIALLALAVFLALRFNPRQTRVLRRARPGLRRLASRPWWCCALIVGLSLGINLCLTLMRYPLPWVHDEFSYVLAADTFAHGRLSNPRHPMWEHLETFHVLSTPGYMSKYPPASGMFMGLGQWMTGHPIVGVWLALALACAAMYWMLRAWTAPRWAAIGGLVIASSAPLIRAWGQSYWGGSVALLGGALVFGGLRRIGATDETPKTRDAVLTGCGMLLLANSRPLEGLLCCLPVAACLLVWLVREGPVSRGQRIRRVVVPMMAVGLAGLAGMGVYNRAVTGDALTLPYKLHDQTYSASSLVIWKTPPPVPRYNHPRMEQFYRQWGRDRQLAMRNPAEYMANLSRKFTLLWNFLPLGIGWSLIPLFWLWRSPWWRLAIGTIAAVLLVHTQLSTSWMYPHYLAPVVALFLAVNVECLRRLNLWQRSQRHGQLLVRIVVILALLKLVPMFIDWTKESRIHPRQYVIRQLASDPARRHLVIVSYGDDYRIVDDWVYNAADPDAARIVWARDMGKAKNEQLVEYFQDRKVWRWHLESDDDMTLRPWTGKRITLTGSDPFGKSCLKTNTHPW